MTPKDEEEPKRSFKVDDRRRFVETGSGDARPDPDAEAAELPPEEPSFQTRPSEREEGHDLLPEMSFTTFVMGITTQALMHLGEIADPAQPQPARDLGAAKQMIDLLGILRDKTKGNLDPAEDQLLGSMLYDLRMRYVEVSRNG